MDKLKLLILICIPIILLSFVSAVAPGSSQTFIAGYEIEIPTDNVLKTGENYEFDFHVYNISNGMPRNVGIGCYFHIYNQRGEHIYANWNSTTDEVWDYEFIVTADNFSSPGMYYYNIQCNSTTFGGYRNSNLEVRNNGAIVTTAEAVTFVAILLSSIFLFLLCLYGSIAIPFSNRKNPDGQVIGINDLKYFKVLLIVFDYILLMWIFGLFRSIASNYTSLDVAERIFYYAFWVMLALFWPLLIVILIAMVVIWSENKKIKRLINRGVNF